MQNPLSYFQTMPGYFQALRHRYLHPTQDRLRQPAATQIMHPATQIMHPATQIMRPATQIMRSATQIMRSDTQIMRPTRRRGEHPTSRTCKIMVSAT